MRLVTVLQSASFALLLSCSQDKPIQEVVQRELISEDTPAQVDSPAKRPFSPDGIFEVSSDDVDRDAARIMEYLTNIKAIFLQESSAYESVGQKSMTTNKVNFTIPREAVQPFAKWLKANSNVSHSTLKSHALAAHSEGHVPVSVYISKPYRPSQQEGNSRLRIGYRASRLNYQPARETRQFRQGSGLIVTNLRDRVLSLNVDAFEREHDETQPILVSLGTNTDLSFGLPRQWLTPLIGFHLGYASFSKRSHFLLDIEASLEIFRWRGLACDVFYREVAFLNKDDSSIGQMYGAQLLIPL